MTDHVFDLRTAGFTRIPGALAPARAARLADVLTELFDQDDQVWGAERLVAMNQRGALHNLIDQHPVIADLLDDSPIYPIIDAILGDGYILNSSNALALFPGLGRFPWDFHIDQMDLLGAAFTADTTPGINCLYYVGDVTEENGATWIIPGSHRAVVTHPSAELLEAIAVPAVMSAGDALLFDSRLWHCAGTNHTDRQRNAVKMLYTRRWYRPVLDHTRSVRPEIIARLGKRGRSLLGFGATPATSVVELRTGEPAEVN